MTTKFRKTKPNVIASVARQSY